jgi:predicted RNA-binding Zn ribbon-like protein
MTGIEAGQTRFGGIMFLELFGGLPCLDFANTVDGRATAHPEELLHSYADLAAWSVHAGLVSPATATRLARRGSEADFRTAVALREAIFDVFTAVARGRRVPAPALAEVRGAYARAVTAGRLVPAGDVFDWQFAGDDPGRAWWPVAISAVRLLTGGPLDRVKVCAAEAGCIGLFVDTSKNRSRRWCTMDGCGIDAKVQRQATRRRAARQTSL